MSSTDLALRDDRYLATLPQMAQTFARSTMCPDQFRGKPADVEVIGYSLAALGVRLSFPTLAQCYVIKGVPRLMAQLQASLASVHDHVDIEPKTDEHGRQLSTDALGVVEVTRPGKKTVEVTFSIEDAKKANLIDKDNWRGYPRDMLIARATTRAVSWYAPNTKLGLSAAGVVDEGWSDPPAGSDTHNEADAPSPSSGPTTSADASPSALDPFTFAPDGTTIPHHLRELAIDHEERARLIDVLSQLPDDTLTYLKTSWQQLRIPNLRTNQVTQAHGALIWRLIAEAQAATAPPEPTPEPEAADVDDEDGRPFE